MALDDETLDAILDAVRGFVHGQVIPAEAEIEDTDTIPERIRAGAAALGLFGYALPAEYGLGFGMLDDVRLALEVGYTAPAFRSMFGTNNGIAGQVLVDLATDAQKKRYLPAMANGDLIASFALTEPEAGSDPSGVRTRAERTATGWRITGQKRFITNATRAGVFIVFARTGTAATGTKGISVFAVDAPAEGLTVGRNDAKMGQHGSSTAEVFFDGVEIPEEALIGGAEGAGFRAAMRALSRGRLHVAACCVGLARRLIDESVAYAAQARQGGTPIGSFQLVQAMLADSWTEYAAGRALVLDAARAYDAGTDRRLGPSSAKLFCSEMVGRVADRAVQIHGGVGYMRSTAVERFYRDARLYRIYEGTSEVQRVMIAKRLLETA